MSGGKGKRGPTGPIATTSDEDEPGPGQEDPAPPHTEHDYALPDHDYENVSSPGNSSTASGPTYVRQPGFTHHAHEVTVSPVSRPKIKKKKTALLSVKDGLRKRDPTPPKTRPKRGKSLITESIFYLYRLYSTIAIKYWQYRSLRLFRTSLKHN